VKQGGQFRVHLAQPLVLDGTLLAPAGTSAHLVVADKIKRADGMLILQLALADFRLKQGELPIAPVSDLAAAVTAGQTIAAQTQGSVEHSGDRTFIRVAVPVPLSSSAPNAGYTPFPALTAAPILAPPRRGSAPTPLPTTFNPAPPPDPSPSPSA
jgi:hypothetical protein